MAIPKTTKIDWFPCDIQNPKRPGYYTVTKIIKGGTKPFVSREYFHPSKGWADKELGTTVVAWAPTIEPYKPM